MLFGVILNGDKTDMCFAAMASDDPKKIALEKWPDLENRDWSVEQVKRQFSE